MLKNYFKIAVRNLFKNKVLSFINITGLALGIAAAAMLLLNMRFEWSIDRFHEKKDYIYKAYNKAVMNGNVQCWDAVAAPLGPALKNDYPEIKQVARVAGTYKLFAHGDKMIQSFGNYTDAAFLNMFSFPLVKGNASTALKNVYAIVITETFAKKLFGDGDPINKIIRADNADNFTVTGVLKDLPGNTKFQFEYLLPWKQSTDINDNESWKNQYTNTYVELQPSASIATLNNKIAGIVSGHSVNEQQTKVFLYPLTQVNLYGRFENGKPAGGNINELRMLGMLAVIILLIAAINFMNLSTARSEKRGKEVGIRKVMGAAKQSLVGQFIGESIIMALIAGIIALAIIQLLWPMFSMLTKTRMDIPWESPYFWLSGLAVVLFTGILAGSYPAFYLSSFKPVKVLKGILKTSGALVTPRKVLVIVQFVLAVFLINFTILFRKQVKYGENRDIGFVKENLVFHSMTADLRKNYDLVKNELLNTGIATSVCSSNTPLTRGGTGISGLEWEGTQGKNNVSFELLETSGDYVATNGLTLAAGRDINIAQFPTDTASCMINEAAAKVLGFKNPVGKIIVDDGFNWKIIGVVKDFFMGSPGSAVSPALIRGSKWGGFINIRLKNNASVQTFNNLEGILKKYNPNFLTEYQFADLDYADKFKQAHNAVALINSFAVIAIFISCMGLFGLATYMAENRTREIGIRKVLGASVSGITALLTREFIKLVMIAIVIASPLAWLFMYSFLQQFAYRTTISWWIFIATGISALLIAVFTVSYQSIKAAIANPVKSLRTE